MLSDSSVKSKQEIPKLAESSLAKLDLDGGIIFSKTWTYDQVVNAMCEYLPEVFGYLDKLPETDTPHWVLCFRQQRTITLGSGVTFPTGQNLDFFKGTTRAAWSECIIWIGASMSFNR